VSYNQVCDAVNSYCTEWADGNSRIYLLTNSTSPFSSLGIGIGLTTRLLIPKFCRPPQPSQLQFGIGTNSLKRDLCNQYWNAIIVQ
jgi:hypothetical protein